MSQDQVCCWFLILQDSLLSMDGCRTAKYERKYCYPFPEYDLKSKHCLKLISYSFFHQIYVAVPAVMQLF